MQRIALVLVAAITGCGGGQAAAPRAPEALAALSFETLDGAQWNSADGAGQVQVIDVWASWCQPCRKGFGRLAELAQRHPSVRFTAVSIDEDREAVESFMRQTPIAFAVALDRTQSLTEAPMSITRVPTVLVVDRAGVVQHRLEEPDDADYDRLDALLAELSR